MHQSVIALIPARKGSKGVPRKKLAKVGGKTLIARAIEGSIAASVFDEIIVSSDDEEVFRIARLYGVTVIERPRELAANTISSDKVISNVIDHGLDPQQSVEAPRWANTPGTDPSTIDDPFVLELEPGIAPEEVAKLRAKGHVVDLKDPPHGGSVKLIMIDPDTGVRMAASDSRTDGYAAVI